MALDFGRATRRSVLSNGSTDRTTDGCRKRERRRRMRPPWIVLRQLQIKRAPRRHPWPAYSIELPTRDDTASDVRRVSIVTRCNCLSRAEIEPLSFVAAQTERYTPLWQLLHVGDCDSRRNGVRLQTLTTETPYRKLNLTNFNCYSNQESALALNMSSQWASTGRLYLLTDCV